MRRCTALPRLRSFLAAPPAAGELGRSAGARSLVCVPLGLRRNDMPSFSGVLLYLFVWMATIFYGPYAVYLILKRRPRYPLHVLCLCFLTGLSAWLHLGPSDLYKMAESVCTVGKRQCYFLREDAFQDPHTYLCVRDYAKSGQKLIYVGILNDSESTYYESAAWSADGSSVTGQSHCSRTAEDAE
jgi:hypothetical protein